jgi:gas vesicle protein
MAVTIDAIGERLSPENLIEQAKSSAREATVGRIKDMTNMANQKVDGMSHSLGQTIRDNPLPVAVIGLGLGWLLLSERTRRDDYRMSGYDYRTGGYRYYEDTDQRGRMGEARDTLRGPGSSIEHKAAEIKFRAGEAAQNIGSTISETAQRVGESISDTAQRAGESISDKAHQVGESVSDRAETVQGRAGDVAMRTREEGERLRHEAQWRSQMAMDRTRQTFRNTMDENPLALGAVLAIAGAAIGAAIPTSDYENRLMGETRDRLLDEAKERAQDVVGRVQTVVEETQQAAISEAKSAAQRQNLTSDSIVGGDSTLS